MRTLLLVSALAIPLSGCIGADGSISLDPNTAHIAAGLIVAGEPLVCAKVGKSDLCNKKTAKAIGSAIEGAANPPPPSQ